MTFITFDFSHLSLIIHNHNCPRWNNRHSQYIRKRNTKKKNKKYLNLVEDIYGKKLVEIDTIK